MLSLVRISVFRMVMGFLLVLGGEVFAQSATQSAPAQSDPGFEEKLLTIDRRAAEWKDLSSAFIQQKQSPLLRKPLVSEGVVKAKGAVSLWETSKPEVTVMTVDPKQLRLYYPKQKLVEEYPIEGQLGMMAASPVPRLNAIRETFKLSPDDGKGLEPAGEEINVTNRMAVILKPANEQVARFVDHVRVLLDADRGLVLVFELVDPDGERTVIRFSNLKGNLGLSDEAMKLNLPQGTKIVRPLGDSPAMK